MEEWKPIKKFEMFYEISNNGKVRNATTKAELKQRKNNRGYHIIELYGIDIKTQQPIKQTTLVHRLVAEAFLRNTGKNPDGTEMTGKNQVNHKDGNKSNNKIENLEWCDQSYNMRESYRLGLRKYSPHEITNEYKEKMRIITGSRPHAGKEVEMIDPKTMKVLYKFNNSKEAVKKFPELNLKDSEIRDVANGRRNRTSYKGYIWKFTGKITNGNKCRNSKR